MRRLTPQELSPWHGLDNLFVADASTMPTIPRANTNLSAIALAERLADSIGA